MQFTEIAQVSEHFLWYIHTAKNHAAHIDTETK